MDPTSIALRLHPNQGANNQKQENPQQRVLRPHLTPARNGDILPANNRLKHASPTDFILASARP